MKKSFIVEIFVDVEIDDLKLEQSLKDYRECINSNDDIVVVWDDDCNYNTPIVI